MNYRTNDKYDLFEDMRVHKLSLIKEAWWWWWWCYCTLLWRGKTAVACFCAVFLVGWNKARLLWAEVQQPSFNECGQRRRPQREGHDLLRANHLSRSHTPDRSWALSI